MAICQVGRNFWVGHCHPPPTLIRDGRGSDILFWWDAAEAASGVDFGAKLLTLTRLPEQKGNPRLQHALARGLPLVVVGLVTLPPELVA